MYMTKHKPKALVDTDGMPNGEWLKWRTTGIGGSDAAAIYGLSPWTTKRALYYAKIGTIKDASPNPYTLDFGHCVEPFVATWFQQAFETKYKSWLEGKLGKKIAEFNIYKDTYMYQHPDYPFMQANLDYRFRVKTAEGEVIQGIFECKTTSYHIAIDKWGHDECPDYYETQCRHYMAIMNVPYTIIACAWGNNENDYGVAFIERDEESEKDLISREKDFWENNVKKGVAPPLDPNKGAQELEAFKSYRISDLIKAGKLKEIDPSEIEVMEACNDYLSYKAQKDALEAEISKISSKMDASKVTLLEALSKNDIDEIFVNKQFLVKNKASTTKRLDTARVKSDYPEIYEKCLKTTNSTRFTIKDIS